MIRWRKAMNNKIKFCIAAISLLILLNAPAFSQATSSAAPQSNVLENTIVQSGIPASETSSQVKTDVLPALSQNLPESSGPLQTKPKPSWWEGLLIIIYSDAVMSVENVLIIAILVSEIPDRVRLVAVFFGLLAAGLFRVVFASMATILMKYPVVALLGAITLIFLAVSLFTDTVKQLRKKPAEPHAEEKIDWLVVKEELRRMFREKGFWSTREGEGLKTVMTTVILQDILLSLDNVLVVAGNAHGDLSLTLIGVLISIIMMGTIANLMVALVKKYPVLGFIGGLALAKAAYNLFVESYSPEAAVIAFGSIVAFIMFGRVYSKLTSDEEEIKPLSISLNGISQVEGVSAEAAPAVPVQASMAASAKTSEGIPGDILAELIEYLKKNSDALQRVEMLLAQNSAEQSRAAINPDV